MVGRGLGCQDLSIAALECCYFNRLFVVGLIKTIACPRHKRSGNKIHFQSLSKVPLSFELQSKTQVELRACTLVKGFRSSMIDSTNQNPFS